jgi:toxin-antitoxin system PIN domain toxin
MLPDVNVLIAAFRKDHPQHPIAADWLKQTLASTADGQLLLLPIGVISSFLRLVTNAKIFPIPTPAGKAVDFIDWLLEDPKVEPAAAGAEWPDMRKLVLKKQLVANQIPDAQLAAMAIHRSEPLVTFDKGFRQLLPPSLLVFLQPNS